MLGTGRRARAVALAGAALLVAVVGGRPWGGERLHGAARQAGGTASDALRQVPRLTLEVPGLRGAVEVRRDRWGVPHIYAESQHDLFFAQGYVAAQDRLFQMEMWRRAGEGRVAEVTGPAAVERDRMARLVKYRGDMDAEWASYAPDAKEIVAAFVAGVNAYIAQALAANRLPVEFGLLGFKPEPWTVEVPLARATSLSGTGNATGEILRAQLVALLGATKVDELFPSDPVRALDPAPGLDLAGIDNRVLRGAGSAFSDVAYARLEGSNNWVVSGAKTASGKPILANDPHRAITNPAVRYITHLVGPGWNVIGAGEPASPGVAIGHNERIGFGLTIVGMDMQDVYVETLGVCDGPPPPAPTRVGGPPQEQNAPGATTSRNQSIPALIPALPSRDPRQCYWHDGRWRPITTITETVRVKGETPRDLRLQFTGHGAVITVDTAGGRAYVLRSVYHEPGTASYLASLSLNRARNWAEFEAAMARWRMPSENMVYADVDGNIGWIAGGLMPKRTWSGMLPVPGDGRYEWSGFVPGGELPRAYNPAEGFIATANHNILPSGYTTPIAYEWTPRYRIDRIRDVLRAPTKFTVEDFKRLQHDDYSKLAEALVPRLVAGASRRGAMDRPDVQLLATWDLRMSREQSAPTLFAAWGPRLYRHVVEAVFAGQQDVIALAASRTRYDWVERMLSRMDSSTFAGGSVAADSLLLASLAAAHEEVVRLRGSDVVGWRWGEIHRATLRHPVASRYDLPPVSRGGDANTVFATGGSNFHQTSGASYRQIIDFSDFDNSWATNVPGQSADPASRHYSDLLALWGRDAYFPLAYSRQRVEEETEQVTWLRPPRPGRH